MNARLPYLNWTKGAGLLLAAQLVVGPAPAATAAAISSTGVEHPAARRPLTGRILDGTDQSPLAFASVAVKGTNRGTTTDANGAFTLEVEDGDVLVVSYVGYELREIEVPAGATTLDVPMKTTTHTIADVIVVGNRASEARTNVDLPVPVDVLTAKEITKTGQTELGQMIHFTAPSFNSTKHAISNVTSYVDPATLRGLGPDQTLVLVNGKRRHQSSALNVNNVVGRGSVGTDLNAIPTAAIERVEILRDGAAAQYGSDAIAGIVNIVLKKNPRGGVVTGNYGITAKGDGATYDTGINFGLPVGKRDGFLNLTAQGHHNDPTDRSGNYTGRVYNSNQRKDDSLVAVNGFNRHVTTYGTAKNTMGQFFYNGEVALGDKWRLYSFGGYSYKDMIAYGFFRNPSNKSRAVLSLFPNGYNPVFPATVQDVASTVGVRSKTAGGWNVDLSAGFGQNVIKTYANHTVNPSYGSNSPTDFYTGTNKFGQALADVNVSKSFEVSGLKSLSLAYGSEFRVEQYQLLAGDEASWKKGPVNPGVADVGSSGREGIGTANAVKRTRNNVGVYVDVLSDISDKFLVGVAGRFENYSDFGANVSGKVSTRYKFTDLFSVRGSINRGFRAPSMHQLYYSNYADAQWLTLNGVFDSYPIAHLRNDNPYVQALGVGKLKAETTLDYNLGLTAQVTPDLVFTADAYQIDITDRVVISGQLDATKPALAPTFAGSGFAQVQFFSNALDTRTRGLDVVASYRKRMDRDQEVGLNLAMALNETKVQGEVRSPAKLSSLGTPLVDRVMIGLIEKAQPRSKFIGSANYRYKKIEGLVRATRFGEVTAIQTTPELDQTFSAKIITDASVTYSFTPRIGLTLGANNLFNVYPDQIAFPSLTASGQTPYTRFTSQFGFMGAYYFTALRFSF
ncbi:TonB-dependent receptor [Hymenobacter sp. BT770]|uniref:TonB-dependent receptor n=1 Tax=Hymenobacter sp. BT770 TaxID=2886942 RepID=UPI001D122AC0|nr:TonB-dependent receptor [Hymenobacter sp. BT770]MCC3151895.1 TonB-dependent receptor [Hymenobacter sp. BT770]MDO3413483.1 TonB-dependent receptor [Hymenobacter sp. BT770]